NRFYEVTMQPLLDAEGIIRGVLGLAIDRTEQQRLQLQMEQAQRLESIGRLAGGIAHDFNNVLAAISGFAEIAQMQLPPDHLAQNALQQILNGVERASQMVSQLLAVASRRVIAPQPTNLNDLITESLSMLQRLLGEDVEIQTYLVPDLGVVRIDPVQIQQVLLNLAANARAAMPTGGKLLIETTNITLDTGYADTHWSVQPGEYVLLSVTDTGHGIPSEHLSMVFEPFFTTREEGTGLGLAMVHGIVTQANGYIHVYSEEGQGTTFKIYLPRVEQAAQSLIAPAVPTQVAPQGQGTILLVEDDESTREAIAQMGRMLGYEVVAVATPQEAIQQFQQAGGQFDLLLTDVILPQMRGSQLAEQLKALNPNLKVLYISGYTANAIAERGELKPGVECLEKPFTMAQLAQRLQKLLQV
ncbi:MAG: ATP-binding protein, partial [Fimbriimonadales bacterium]|nr:ATP-binding protein [Fimbriimonadales bacterium]